MPALVLMTLAEFWKRSILKGFRHLQEAAETEQANVESYDEQQIAD
jgi:hypothetical protein